jgi:hypothetical protein
MLIDRLRPENTEGIIYHYCSAQTLLSIVRNRTIRFSQVIGIARGPALAASFDTLCQLMRVIVAPFATPVSRSYELWRG